ncbi:hypothetical protein AVEN_199462-1 [Araneus ventricosus]|uniref:Helitron helicase-like domain-containing protein n=1 Tax=Araneus ventricosus TaxID=182803 RepID=A0A4Y2LCJ0_ARAVE|nr:hypothetical protein AVEN_199462-1 [Araneus ventricosus]
MQPLIGDASKPKLQLNLAEKDAEAHHLVIDRQIQRIRNGTIHFIEAQVETRKCGPMSIICHFYKSKNFAAERPSDGKFTCCCHKGKIKFEKPQMHKVMFCFILILFLTNPNNPDYKDFHDNIRSYNNAVSFVSMGAK